MTTTFHLVRHGAHDRLDHTLCGRMPGVVLGEPGRAQAEALARRFADERVAAVYASPLERARETAAPIAAAKGLEVRVLDAVNELEFGAWSGLGFEALREDPRWEFWNSARHVTRPPGGETILEVQARAVGALEALRADHDEEAVVLVTHSDVIKVVMTFFLGLAIDAMRRFEVGPASISTLVVGDWGAKVESLNERPWLVAGEA